MREIVEKLKNIDSFIDYLETTDDNEWCEDVVRTKGNEKNCVMGHLVNWYFGKDYEGKLEPVWSLFQEMWATTYMLYPVNDGENEKYQQETPKERTIAYLKDLRDGNEKTTSQLMEEHKKSAKNK